MEIFPEKKISQVKINNKFDYFQKIKIETKKYSNSAEQFNNKKRNFINKYKLTDKYVYSVINKTFKKYKTSLLKSKNNFTKDKIFENLVNKGYLNMKTIKGDKLFKINENKNTNIIINNNINIININENLTKKKKSKTIISDSLLPFPIKSKKLFKKEDFDIIALCGQGAYGKVVQVKLKQEQEDSKEEKYYALKVIDIQSMKKVNKIYQIYIESEILHELNSPYIVKIFGTFQRKNKVYMVLEYLSNGNFSNFLKNNYPLKEDTIKFYSAEIVLFLEYLQSQKIVHRDLKPENIMLNDKYHLVMIDFATVRKIGLYYDKLEMKFKKDDIFFNDDNEDIKGAKLVIKSNKDDESEEEEENEDIDENKNTIEMFKKLSKSERNKTFVGTAEYVSPEVIANKRADYAADIWAFGVILYQMYCGQTPFKSANNYLTFKNIEKMKINYPENINVPKTAKDLIEKILIKDPEKRLGAGEPNTDLDIAHLKKHPFFKDIKWKNIINKNVPNSKNFKFKNKKKIIKTNKNENEIKLEKDEKKIEVIKTGVLLKKSFWFIYSEKFLILDNTPKIDYRKVDKNNIDGTIMLNKRCRVYAINADTFNLDTPNGNYKFKSKNNDLIVWINEIKECIKKYGKE